jgi:iron complex outermembrane recepter protein
MEIHMGCCSRSDPARVFLGCLLLIGWFAPLHLASGAEDFFELDLREVLDLEVTSPSRKPQAVSQAAAAVSVITSDDIRRSAARTLPDLLRTVPGIQVANITASSWAVSARGLNGRFSNKLLVLIDGRSVYAPTFTGVYWDVQDTALEDIDRIEVIRGPGGTLWGSNAFHGVINIITRSAASTQGNTLQLGAGNEEEFSAGLRHGGTLGAAGHYRVYFKGFDRDASGLSVTGATAADAWQMWRFGARADFNSGDSSALTLQGDAYQGNAGETLVTSSLAPPFRAVLPVETRVRGANALARWQRETGTGDSLTLQAWVDYTRRDWPAHALESRTTYDMEFQYHLRSRRSHDVIFGFGLRDSSDSFSPATRGVPADVLQLVELSPVGYPQRLMNVFAQDDITLRKDRLVLTLGAKLEHHADTGGEFSPNLRLLWTPNEDTSLWGAASRAVRTPGVLDRRGRLVVSVVPPAGFPVPQAELITSFTRFEGPLPFLLKQGSSDVKSEEVVSFELGLKRRLSDTMSLDVAVFHNEYDHLRTLQLTDLQCAPSGLPAPGCLAVQPPATHLLLNSSAGSGGNGWGRGAEVSFEWTPSRLVRVQAAYSRVKTRTHAPDDPNEITPDRDTGTPANQWNIGAFWYPQRAMDLGLTLRNAGATYPAEGVRVPAYTELDTRFAWRPRPNVELSVSGRNLLHSSHPEYTSEVLDVALTAVQRSVFAQVSLQF